MEVALAASNVPSDAPPGLDPAEVLRTEQARCGVADESGIFG
jgi:hypothetical protein